MVSNIFFMEGKVFVFHNVLLLVLFVSGVVLGFWSMRENVRYFFSWLRSRRKNP